MLNKPQTIEQVFEQSIKHIDRIKAINEAAREKQEGIIVEAEAALEAAEDQISLAEQVKENFSKLFGLKS